VAPGTLLQGRKRAVKAQSKEHQFETEVPSGCCSEIKSYAHAVNEWQVLIKTSLPGAEMAGASEQPLAESQQERQQQERRHKGAPTPCEVEEAST
jgi:hypothetical protein